MLQKSTLNVDVDAAKNRRKRNNCVESEMNNKNCDDTTTEASEVFNVDC